MAIIHVENDNFDEVTKNGRILLDFYADWCFPCKSMIPVLDKLSAANPDLVIGKINTDEQRELAGKFRIMSIPTFLLLEDGEEIRRRVGAASLADMQDWIEG